jgi:GGDEF domain-containing protein
MTSRVVARSAGRLAAAVLAAAVLVALLEAAVLDVTVLGALRGSGPQDLDTGDRWRVLQVLAVGSALTVPLTMLLGGWGLVRAHARAVRDLTVDDLTGVGSRRAFGADLPEAVRTANDAGQPLTLALVELAEVTAAVDLLGRRRAELLVCAAAATLGAPPHATYRLSGEVFAVVLPGVGPDAAFDLVDGLIAEVSRTAAPLSAGAGLATLDARCPDAQLLLVGASAALDEARGLGSGRAVASAEEGSGLRWIATPGHP